MQISQLLAAQGRLTELAQIMLTERASNPELALQLYLIEIESLVDQAPEVAIDRTNEALETFPLDSNLLYSRAMLA